MPQPLQLTLNGKQPCEAAVGISELLSAVAEGSRLTRTQIAHRMNCHPAYITKILKQSNLTVETLAKFAGAMGIEITISVEVPFLDAGDGI